MPIKVREGFPQRQTKGHICFPLSELAKHLRSNWRSGILLQPLWRASEEQGKAMLRLQTGPLEQILQSGVNFNNICYLKREDEKKNQGMPSSIFRLK